MFVFQSSISRTRLGAINIPPEGSERATSPAVRIKTTPLTCIAMPDASQGRQKRSREMGYTHVENAERHRNAEGQG